jgi:hypothetical protein
VNDVFEAKSRLLGVDGGKECTDDGVVGVAMLVTDECAECPPSLD